MKGRTNIRAKWVLLLVINLPWLITVVGLNEPVPLKGSRGQFSQPTNWIEATEQDFWGRAFLIRLRNTVDYLLFDEIHAMNVSEGPTGILFEDNYIETARGKDAIGPAEVARRLAHWKRWQTQSGVPFTLVLAPGKAAFYGPEHWPAAFTRWPIKNAHANYRDFSAALSTDSTLHVLDYWARFQDLRTSAYTVFPRNGIHWSQFYISHVAADFTAHIRDVSYTITDTLPCEPYGTDEDVEQSMNLLFDLEDDPAFRVAAHWERGPHPERILIIGDSFAWGVVKEELLNYCAPGSEFWYYNKQRFGPDVPNPGKGLAQEYGWKSESDFVASLQEFDRVFWVVTDAKLKQFPFYPPTLP